MRNKLNTIGIVVGVSLALLCIGYYVITGTNPFSGGSADATIFWILAGGGTAVFLIWFRKGVKSILLLPDGTLTRSLAWVTLTILFTAFLILVASGSAGLKAVIDWLLRQVAYLGAWLQVWSTPNQGPSRRTSGASQLQNGSVWDTLPDWATLPNVSLAAIAVIGLAMIFWPERKK